MQWQTSRFLIDLSAPKVMGIVNVTPDSFSDGGKHATVDTARRHCDQLVQDGADILDIGGESSRPGAMPVSLEDELARVLPIVRHAVTLGVPVSVDTYKPAVMQAVLDMGADIINDIWALRWRDRPGGLSGESVVAGHARCGVCLMHMHRDPQTMQVAPMEGDVVPQVLSFLELHAHNLRGLGIEMAVSAWTLASDLASPWRRTLRYWHARRTWLHWAIRCWQGGRANRHWPLSRRRLRAIRRVWMCRSDWCLASRLPCWQCRTGRMWCGCTM